MGEDETEHISSFKPKRFYQQQVHLTAHEICEKAIQITRFRRGVSADEQAAVCNERPRKIPIRHTRSTDNSNACC
jgi:hypothetical protein